MENLSGMRKKEEEVFVVTVYENKSNGQKLVTIPKDCPIKAGDKIVFKKKEEEQW